MRVHFLRRNKENYKKYQERTLTTNLPLYLLFDVCIKINNQYYGLDKARAIKIIQKDAIEAIKEFKIYDLVKTSRLKKHPDFSRAEIDNTWMIQNISGWLYGHHKDFMTNLFKKEFPEEFI